MKSRKRALMALALTLAACMLLVACSTGSAPSAAPTSGTESPSGSAPEPTGEKVFRMARSWEDKTYDPATFTGNDQIALTPHIFETLLRLEMDGSVSPLLAESYDVAADGQSVTFKLRKGVQWHHGYGEFTSADVKFSFERHNDPAVGSIHAEALNLSNISSIDTPDDYSVVFNFIRPDVDFPARCAQYISIIISKAHYDDAGLEGIQSSLIGTGPFQFDKGTMGVETQAVAFDDFWGGRPKIDRIINTVITDTNALYSAFENGELDLIFVYYQDKVDEYVSKGYISHYLPSRQLLYVGCNMQNKPFDDPRVREAFFASIDPQTYVDSLYNGSETFTGGWIPPTCKYSLPNAMQSTYNPARAKALLAEAGYPNGLDVTLWTVNDEISTPPALLTENVMSEAGFRVELQMVDFGVFIDKVRAGEADMWLLYNSTPPLTDDTIVRYRSDKYPGSNWCGTTDPAYDELVQNGLDATTEAEKRQYYEEAQRYFAGLNVLYPVNTYGYHFVTQPGIEGVELWGDLSLRLRNAHIK